MSRIVSMYTYEPPSKSIVYAWYKNVSYRFWGGPIDLDCFVQINKGFAFDLGSNAFEMGLGCGIGLFLSFGERVNSTLYHNEHWWKAILQ